MSDFPRMTADDRRKVLAELGTKLPQTAECLGEMFEAIERENARLRETGQRLLAENERLRADMEKIDAHRRESDFEQLAASNECRRLRAVLELIANTGPDAAQCQQMAQRALNP